MFKCDLCGVKFKEESELEDHIQECYCMDCDLKFECEDEVNNHIEQEHISWIKYEIKDHIPLCYCINCSVIFEKEDEFDNHVSQVHVFKCDLCGVYEDEESGLKDHIEEHHGSSLEPTAEANDDKHEEEVDKASTDEEHTNDGALFEEPMIPTRSNEEILTYSVLSMAVYSYIGEVESTDVNELAKLSHSVELRVHKQQRDKEENGNDHEGKNEEENSGDNEKEDTEKGDACSETLEIAYDLSIAQKNATSNHCEKCDLTFKSKKKLRRHMIKEHVDSSNDQEAFTGIYCEKCDLTFKSKKR